HADRYSHLVRIGQFPRNRSAPNSARKQSKTANNDEPASHRGGCCRKHWMGRIALSNQSPSRTPRHTKRTRLGATRPALPRSHSHSQSEKPRSLEDGSHRLGENQGLGKWNDRGKSSNVAMEINSDANSRTNVWDPANNARMRFGQHDNADFPDAAFVSWP